MKFKLGYLEFTLSSLGRGGWVGSGSRVYNCCVRICTLLIGISRVRIVHFDCLEFTLLKGALEFTLFSGMVWSSHCSVGWSEVHIVQWDGLEFTFFSGVYCSSHC